jgi:hypothetical protein
MKNDELKDIIAKNEKDM